jgi:hypothetical protein
VIDSTTFGSQAADVSYGRCPDGTGPFSVRPSTTPGVNNCAVGISETTSSENSFFVYPNPAKNYFAIKGEIGKQYQVEVINSIGQKVAENSFTGQTIISSQGWANGIYFVRCNNFTKKLVINN